MSTRSSAFALIELLVVTVIIGILAAVGTMSYSGYVSSSKKSATENAMQQIALAQTEYLSNVGNYYGATGGSCSPSQETSAAIENALFDGGDIITSKMGYDICVARDGAGFIIQAKERENSKPCEFSMDANNVRTSGANC